jgi:iron complex outermembrane receptor protein
MTRSKLRKIRRLEGKRSRTLLRGIPLASALLAATGVAHAQQADEEGRGLDEVVVTALKTQQNLQDVPLSIQAIGTERLEELGVKSFDDYVKFLPSVSFQQAGPGFARVFMRGAAAGDNGNHSGPQPGVGQYLDEQPITTIQGALDIHMYDIARVEALAGPQGTLYGASSQSGTLRIITNKPDKSGFSAGYGLEGNTVSKGEQGYLAEGFVNIPLGDRAAIRMVGWVRHDAGYVDNIEAVRTFPTSGISMNSLAENNYNDADTFGARAALKIDLNDNWSITPTVMGQKQKSNGIYAGESDISKYEVAHWHDEGSDDQWVQAALTVEGKMSNFDLSFTSSYLMRDVETNSDYSDYAFFYDTIAGYGTYFYDNNGDLINPSQYIEGKDGYTKISHEARFSTNQDARVRFVGGVFFQRQTHDIQQAYKIDGLADISDVTGWDDTFWLTKQWRVDRDSAVFGELTFDVTDTVSLTAGLRKFRTENSLEGFFGFGLTNPYGSGTGENACFDTGQVFETAPCTNLERTVKHNDLSKRLNATWHATDDVMFYATWSEGFRPGGVNRRGSFPPYKPDFLTNYEIGWKTTWANNTFRFNGAVFRGDWDDFQFSFLGENGLTNITNAGQAELQGVEMDVQWAPTEGFTLYGGLAFQEATLAENFCKSLDPLTGEPFNAVDCVANEPQDFAPACTRLPTTPRIKANLTTRFAVPVTGMDSAHFQASMVHNGQSRSALLPFEGSVLGNQDAYTVVDLSFGVERGNWQAEAYVDNVLGKQARLYRYSECDVNICSNADFGGITYAVGLRPRTIGLKFSQKF